MTAVAAAAPPTALTTIGVVRWTCWVENPRVDGRGYFEIHVGPDHDPDSPSSTFVTRESELYRAALAVEGTSRQFVATWHHAKHGNGRPCKALDALEASR